MIYWKILRVVCKFKGHNYNGDFAYALPKRNGMFKKCIRCNLAIKQDD